MTERTPAPLDLAQETRKVALEEARAAVRAEEEKYMRQRDAEKDPTRHGNIELIRVGISIAEKIIRGLKE